MLPHFADRLAAAVCQKRTPLVVGLDPRWDLIPSAFHQGRSPTDRVHVALVFKEFSRGVIDVVAPLVPAIKPQWAFFEQLGASGLAALEEVIDYARQRGLLVIADAKRGDIGSTAQAYAECFFRPTEANPFCDAVTVNPYMGVDSWQPFSDLARERGTGIFLLVKTSNLGGADIQDVQSEGGRVYEIVADQVELAASQTRGASGYGMIGAVVGATHPRQLIELRARMPSAWILVPGFGAQGGTALDVAGAFDPVGLGALINSSRAILFAHREKKYLAKSANDWQSAVEAACRDAIDQLRAETRAGQLT